MAVDVASQYVDCCHDYAPPAAAQHLRLTAVVVQRHLLLKSHVVADLQNQAVVVAAMAVAV